MLNESYVRIEGEIPLIETTIHAFIREVATRFPDHEALVSVPQKARLSYTRLLAETERVARGLMALGVARGDRVGIWATDNLEWVLLQLATAQIGAVLVNVNPAYRVAELEHAMTTARVHTLFFMREFKQSQYAEMVAALDPKNVPELKHRVVYDPYVRQEKISERFLTWTEVVDGGAGVSDDELRDREASLDGRDPINIQFTSGTTGFPKAVVLTHRNILNNAFFVGEVLGFTEEDRLCVPVPFYHCFGMVASNLACLTHGSTIVVPSPHFEAEAVLATIQAERCTALHGVPTMFVAELERTDFDYYNLSSLRTGIMAGAPCPPELMKKVIERMGCEQMLIGYGQTEASPVTHLTRRSDSFQRRVETVGTSLPHQECKVIHPETGTTLPVDQVGEICFRGYHVMSGYFEQPEATAEAIDADGWLHSGDLGSMDADGYVRITGRLKNMVIRGGENIYPAEIEAHFFEHPKVAQVAVFGVSDEKWGEELGAWIQLHDGASATVDELREWFAARVAHFKVPRYMRIVEEFPMTVTGKIQKFKIREAVEAELAGVGG